MKSSLLIILCLPFSLFAQIKFTHISVDDGLSQSAVRAFSQDSNGYLWVATRDGLNQYDGSNFQVYRHVEGDTGSIASNIIWALESDSVGGLWAATNSGISYFDPIDEQFFNYTPPRLQEFPITHSLDLWGDILLIATEQGLWLFDSSTKSWSEFSQVENTKVSFAHRFSEDAFMMGTADGLFLYKDQTISPILSDEINNCKAFFKTDQEIFVATETILYILRPDLTLKQSVRFTDNPIYFNVGITQDHEGRIWICGNGIYLIDADYQTVQPLRDNRLDQTSLSSSYTTALYLTEDGTVWIGTNGFGIDKYNQYQASITTLSFNPYNENSLSDLYTAGLYVENGHLYAGTRNTLDVFNYTTYPPVKTRHVDFSEINSGLINKILPLTDESMFLATERGLVEMGESYSIRIDGFRIVDFAYLPDGRLLNATANGNKGLIVYNPLTFDYRRLKLLPEDEPLRCLLVEEDGIWVGSDRALYKVNLSLDDYEVYLKNEVPYPTLIKCVFRDSQGILWVGTWGNGLYQLDEEKNEFKLFDLNDQLPNQTIYGILEDKEQNLWMSSNDGILCYKRNEKQIIQFSAVHGLQSDEFNTGSYAQGESGMMFFGGINGLSYFKPDQLLTAPSSSRLFITNVWINQERLAKSEWLDQNLILQPEQQDIRLDFTSVSFNSVSDVRYRYQLKAQEPFIDNGNINQINLTNLSPGNYQVRINCTDTYGRWKDEQTSISFSILTPIWQRPWFIALILTGLLALGLIYNNVRIRNYRKKNEWLEQAVQDRTLQITDQNNEILAQNEELLAQGNLLSEQNSQLEQQHQELLELKNSLEKRVEERTVALHKKNEELEVQYKHIEQFSYITSHNLKGPIASLKGLLFLLPESDNGTDKEIVDNIRKSVFKLDSIITDLASIMDLRKNKERFKVISVSNILKQVVNDLKEECHQKNVKLIVEEPLDDVKIKGLKAYLYSIIYNLIHNSIKYKKTRVDQAYVKVRVSKNVERVHIEVSDNGIGIDMKYAKHKLFRLFQRFTNTYEGKGIGLYMTKIQVETMNGTISLDSKEGEGTTVKVSFPIAE